MSLNNLILPFGELLDQSDHLEISKFSKSLNFETNPSFVFNNVSQENLIDPEIRKSKTCFSKDINLMKFINEVILPRMNSRTKDLYEFRLARDYVTFIRYDKGDFFEWHTDFEKLRINHGDNCFKEMHFLYCIEGCQNGGQLLVKDPNGDVLTIEDARTANSAVVFDKLMKHKGAEVIDGTKIIMTIDLYVLTRARVEACLSQEIETEFSDFLDSKREWISFRGNMDAFNKVWSIIDPQTREFIPFIELKATIDNSFYHVLATSSGINYVNICDDGDKFVYRGNQWYYTKSADRNKLVKRIFNENKDNPSAFLFEAISVLTISEDGNIYGWPTIEFMKVNTNLPTLIDLPEYFTSKEFEDWGWNKTEAGYSYYCNEASYAQFDVNYRYGIMGVTGKVLENSNNCAGSLMKKDESNDVGEIGKIIQK